jgi:hypothetical protein
MPSYYKELLAVNLTDHGLVPAFNRLSLDAGLEVGIPSDKSIIVAQENQYKSAKQH